MAHRPDPAARSLHWAFLGRLAYRPAYALQERLRREIRDGRRDEQLLLVEHPPVFTLGRSASRRDVLVSEEWLAARGVEVVETNRGGQVTYHGPGQLVGYPILNLDPDRRDVRRYVRDLQAVLIGTLADFGIAGERKPEPERIGVWVGEAKIASIGVHLARWITLHGFALNVATELSYFSGIVACGLPTVEMTSIERLTGHAPPLADVAGRLARHAGRVFGRRLVAADPHALRHTAALRDATSKT